MADINQIITLGIGTPADIEHFILDGLNANPGSYVAADTERTFYAMERSRTVTVPATTSTFYVFYEPTLDGEPG